MGNTKEFAFQTARLIRKLGREMRKCKREYGGRGWPRRNETLRGSDESRQESRKMQLKVKVAKTKTKSAQ